MEGEKHKKIDDKLRLIKEAEAPSEAKQKEYDRLFFGIGNDDHDNIASSTSVSKTLGLHLLGETGAAIECTDCGADSPHNKTICSACRTKFPAASSLGAK